MEKTAEELKAEADAKAAAEKAAADAEAAKAAQAAQSAIDAEEFKRLKAERDQLAAEKQQREDANKTELERERDRATKAEQSIAAKDEQVRRLSIMQGVRDVAGAEKIDLDMDAVRALYDAGRFGKVKVEDGEPQGLKEFVKELAKTAPFIVKAAVKAPDIGAGRRGKDADTGDDEQRQEALKKRFRI